MGTGKIPGFESFSIIYDRRQQSKIRHKLIDILFITMSAIVAHCNDFEEIVVFAETNEEWYKKYIELPNGIPSIDTFRRTMRSIDIEQLQKCFAEWARDLAAMRERGIVSIDGKTARGAKDAQPTSAVHLVSAWMDADGLSLGQVKTDEKSNEITAIPELLELLSIRDTIVTIDAMGTQKNIALQIVDKNHADYVLALKGNHEIPYNDVASYFPSLAKEDYDSDFLQTITYTDTGHGRIERREYTLSTDISWVSWAKDWIGLKSVGMVKSNVTDKKSGRSTSDVRFFIASIDSIKDFSRAVREHWAIESVHWTLDVVFKEDSSRIRKDNEPFNLALVRKLAVSILKKEKLLTQKPKSYNVMRFRASLNSDYLEKVLFDNLKID